MSRYANIAAAIVTLFCALPAQAEHKLAVVASFSILGDFVKNVGGERVSVETLVGPNGNSHVYTPSPGDARKLADAKVIVVNGLGLEGWLERLIQASGTKAPVIVASSGIRLREDDRKDDNGHGKIDPHGWQSVANAKTYVENIRDALTAADPSGHLIYQANAAAYLDQLEQLDRDVRKAISLIPADRRLVVTTHRAFGYFADAYGLQFAAPQGLSMEAQPSAKGVAAIITVIRKSGASAVFLENITDTRLMQQIASETGKKLGGILYADTLTEQTGDAPTYLRMVRHNLAQLTAALSR